MCGLRTAMHMTAQWDIRVTKERSERGSRQRRLSLCLLREQTWRTAIHNCVGGGPGEADHGRNHYVTPKLPNNCWSLAAGNYPGYSGELRSCPKNAQWMPQSCSNVAPKTNVYRFGPHLGRFRPNYAKHRPSLTKFDRSGPNSCRIRQNLAQTCPRLADLGHIWPNFAQSDQVSANLDEFWSDLASIGQSLAQIDQGWSDLVEP